MCVCVHVCQHMYRSQKCSVPSPPLTWFLGHPGRTLAGTPGGRTLSEAWRLGSQAEHLVLIQSLPSRGISEALEGGSNRGRTSGPGPSGSVSQDPCTEYQVAWVSQFWVSWVLNTNSTWWILSILITLIKNQHSGTFKKQNECPFTIARSSLEINST